MSPSAEPPRGWLAGLPWVVVVIACATLGLAPFSPQPHVVEKLRWLFGGQKSLAPIDWFDLVMHGAPWALLVAKSVAALRRRG